MNVYVYGGRDIQEDRKTGRQIGRQKKTRYT